MTQTPEPAETGTPATRPARARQRQSAPSRPPARPLPASSFPTGTRTAGWPSRATRSRTSSPRSRRSTASPTRCSTSSARSSRSTRRTSRPTTCCCPARHLPLPSPSTRGRAQPAGRAGRRPRARDRQAPRRRFRAYWESHGGLAQQGYPISDEFTEVSALNGKPYTVQYFERAVFEAPPENQAPYDVLLSQLGTFRYQQSAP